jgi:DnaJ-class molecular chaperone
MGEKKVDCPKCWGGGNIGEDEKGNEIPCPLCGGSGTVTVHTND